MSILPFRHKPAPPRLRLILSNGDLLFTDGVVVKGRKSPQGSFMPGIALNCWRAAARRAYPKKFSRKIDWFPNGIEFPRARDQVLPGRNGTPIAAQYYKILDRINLGFAP